MKTDYKRLYENANYMLVKYQDEIVPGFREQVELQEKQIAELNESLEESAAECARLERRIKSMKKRFRPVVYGQWESWAAGLVRCTACGHEYTDRIECLNFCGNCGAIMRNDGK